MTGPTIPLTRHRPGTANTVLWDLHGHRDHNAAIAGELLDGRAGRVAAGMSVREAR